MFSPLHYLISIPFPQPLKKYWVLVPCPRLPTFRPFVETTTNVSTYIVPVIAGRLRLATDVLSTAFHWTVETPFSIVLSPSRCRAHYTGMPRQGRKRGHACLFPHGNALQSAALYRRTRVHAHVQELVIATLEFFIGHWR